MQSSKSLVRLFQIITLSLSLSLFIPSRSNQSSLRIFRASSPMMWGRVSRLDHMDSRGSCHEGSSASVGQHEIRRIV
ncbi:hypothetical protein F4814DRAFT_426797 [Daldinia grandis]|nr:hypothetical protein F4814DRAFT_426797 [Daldinia grandis]